MLRRRLEDCLLTDAEIAELGPPRLGCEGWCGLPDPFELPGLVPSAEGGACPLPSPATGAKRAAEEANGEGHQRKKPRAGFTPAKTA